MATELVKLLPDGANVVAVIVVVVLFLRQQEKFNLNLTSVCDSFHEQIKAIQKSFQDQNTANQKAFQEQTTAMSQQYFSNQALYQGQIQKLIDAHISVTRDVIVTLQEMKQDVEGINEKIRGYDNDKVLLERKKVS